MTPANESAPRVLLVFWNGAVPVQVTGAKLFQSVQPVVSTARLASTSSKPLASAIVPVAPQPVAARDRAAELEFGPNAGKSEESELASE